MREGGESPDTRRGRCILTPKALEVLKIRYPDASDPIREWLPDRPEWKSGIPEVDILERELKDLRSRGGKIVLYGHDDMDGVTGLYIGMKILGGEGFQVVPVLPERGSDDYGLQPERMEGTLRPGDLLLTVDYGCSAVKGVAWAKELGARVVITDHHTLNPPLPAADGMLNPQSLGPPGTVLSGCGVLYAALVAIFPSWENRTDLLTAVALGTVSDRVPLQGWNRYLLEEFRKTDVEELSGGMRVLAEKWPARGSAWTGSMVRQQLTSTVGKGEGSGIDIFLSFMLDSDTVKCRKIWRDMGKRGRQRAGILSRLFSQALRSRDDQAAAYGMTLIFMDRIPDGMGGTLANKLSRITRRGTLVVSPRDGGKYAGEARSMGDWDMAAFLVSMGEHFISAGGHRMAAGFSCKDISREELRELLLSRIAEFPVKPVPRPHIDLEVEELPSTDELLCLAPFGSEFLPPAVRKDRLRYLLQVGQTTASWCITEESGD